MAGVRRSWIAAALAAGIALAAGCGEEERAPATAATATPTATPERVAEPPAAPPARKVRFRATDGEPVSGRYTPAGRNAPAVVLLHEIRGGVDQWAPLVPFLHEAGFATLAYTSRGSVMESERLPDAIGAVRWLRTRPDVDADRIALVGASIGASTAVLAMATRARAAVDAAVALSPPDSGDIWALQDDDRYRPHDLLLIADASEASSAEGMLDGAVRSRFVQAEGSGHGVALLPERDVHDALLGWLGERVG
jgi:bile acid acyltransferase/acyl-CoA thioester hydrolase-like protein